MSISKPPKTFAYFAFVRPVYLGPLSISWSFPWLPTHHDCDCL